MGSNRSVTMTMSHLNSIKGLSKRTNLVYLDKDRVGSTHLDTLFQELHICNKEVVTYQLATVANGSSQLHPVVPIVLIKTILNRIDRILGNQFLQEFDLLFSSQFLAIRILLLTILQLAVIIIPLTILLNGKLTGSTVHGYLHILSWLIASILNGLTDALECILDTIECRSKTALITYGSRKAAALQQFRQCMEHLSTHADGLLLGRSTHRTDHELLEGDRCIRVSTTINDVHHRNRKGVGIATADVAIQGDVQILGSSMCHSQRHTENSICTQVRLGLGTVEFQHLVVNGALFQGREAH